MGGYRVVVNLTKSTHQICSQSFGDDRHPFSGIDVEPYTYTHLTWSLFIVVVVGVNFGIVLCN